MPIQMGLAALLMSGAMHSGEPATQLTLGADAISQPNGGAAVLLVQSAPKRYDTKKSGKKDKKKSDFPKKE
jgi:hypothetical protein